MTFRAEQRAVYLRH